MSLIKICFLLSTYLLIGSCSSEAPAEEIPLSEPESISTPTSFKEVKDTFSLAYLMGKFEPSEHPDFVLIERKFADREGLYLHKATYESFKKMHAAAAADGIQLVIRSATRNFESQKGIWEAKWKGTRKIENGKDASQAYPNPVERALKILEYSSMPSTSRHHWGTDMDLNNFNNEWFESGEGLKIYNWLQANAANYGFCQPYTAKGPDRPDGYNEERWHWSYMPISKVLTAKAKVELNDTMIEGFLGKEVATQIGVVQKYVLGVSKACQP